MANHGGWRVTEIPAKPIPARPHPNLGEITRHGNQQNWANLHDHISFPSEILRLAPEGSSGAVPHLESISKIAQNSGLNNLEAVLARMPESLRRNATMGRSTIPFADLLAPADAACGVVAPPNEMGEESLRNATVGWSKISFPDLLARAHDATCGVVAPSNEMGEESLGNATVGRNNISFPDMLARVDAACGAVAPPNETREESLGNATVGRSEISFPDLLARAHDAARGVVAPPNEMGEESLRNATVGRSKISFLDLLARADAACGEVIPPNEMGRAYKNAGSPFFCSLVDGNYRNSQQPHLSLGMLVNQNQAISSMQANNSKCPPQMPQYGFPIPYDLNSPREIADAESNGATFQLSLLRPNHGRQVQGNQRSEAAKLDETPSWRGNNLENGIATAGNNAFGTNDEAAQFHLVINSKSDARP